MPRKRGPWTVVGTTEKHRDEFLSLREDRVTRPDGKDGTYCVVEMKPGAAVLPVDGDGQVYLVRQFRYALGAESLEVACGGVGSGETFQDAARRELREELGVRATEWVDLGLLNLDTSIVHCPVGLFVARGLTFGAPEREGTEAMGAVKMGFDDAVRAVLYGGITHAPSCVLILKARERLGRSAV